MSSSVSAQEDSDEGQADEDGSWRVIEDDGTVIASGLSNAAALREYERFSRRPNWKSQRNLYRTVKGNEDVGG
jgi:hypothetical protein